MSAPVPDGPVPELEGGTMAVYSREDVPVSFEDPALGESRTIDSDGTNIAFESWKAGVDTRPLYKDLPGGACQATHWGYVLTGRARILQADGTEETVTAGQAYRMDPGHNVVVEEDSTLIEFTPSEAPRAVQEALASKES
jgi:hypothetical protein